MRLQDNKNLSINVRVALLEADADSRGGCAAPLFLVVGMAVFLVLIFVYKNLAMRIERLENELKIPHQTIGDTAGKDWK